MKTAVTAFPRVRNTLVSVFESIEILVGTGDNFLWTNWIFFLVLCLLRWDVWAYVTHYDLRGLEW